MESRRTSWKCQDIETKLLIVAFVKKFFRSRPFPQFLGCPSFSISSPPRSRKVVRNSLSDRTADYRPVSSSSSTFNTIIRP